MSPAFSEPLSPPESPMSTSSDREEETNVSPPPSRSSSMSTSANQNDKVQFTNRKPKFPTKYHEELQPLSPSTVLPVSAVVTPTHASGVNADLQRQFLGLVLRGCSAQSIDAFLEGHSENVDLNAYDAEGRTPLHNACLADRVDLAGVLVKFGADPRLTTRDGFNLFHLASFVNSSNMFNLLIKLKR